MYLFRQTHTERASENEWLDILPHPIFSPDGDSFLLLASIQETGTEHFTHIKHVTITQQRISVISHGRYEVNIETEIDRFCNFFFFFSFLTLFFFLSRREFFSVVSILIGFENKKEIGNRKCRFPVFDFRSKGEKKPVWKRKKNKEYGTKLSSFVKRVVIICSVSTWRSNILNIELTLIVCFRISNNTQKTL